MATNADIDFVLGNPSVAEQSRRNLVRHRRSCRACTFGEPCKKGTSLEHTWKKVARAEDIETGRCTLPTYVKYLARVAR